MPATRTEQKVEIKLSPKLLKHLRPLLTAFKAQKAIIDAADTEQERIKLDIETAFVDAGCFAELQAGLNIDGFPLKHISGTQKKFNKNQAVKKGYISFAQIEECTKEVPKKSYLMVRVPGEKAREEGDD